MTEQRVSTPPIAAPGSHQLPQRTHGPALSHHSLFAVWGLPGANLHFHSGECTFFPLEDIKISSYLSQLRIQSCPLSGTFFGAWLKSDPNSVSHPGNWRPPHGCNLCGLFSLQRPHCCPASLLLECKGTPQEEKGAVGLRWLLESIPCSPSSTQPQGPSHLRQSAGVT